MVKENLFLAEIILIKKLHKIPYVSDHDEFAIKGLDTLHSHTNVKN